MLSNARAKLTSWFRQAWDLVKDNRRLVYGFLIAWLAMAAIGYLLPTLLEDWVQSIIDDTTSDLDGKNLREIILYLTWSNLLAFGLIVVLGIFFMPLAAVTLNGYLLGAVLWEVMQDEGFGLAWRIAPHGALEIPALCISLAFGLRIGLCLFKRNRFENLKRTYKEAFLVYVFIVLPLTVVAAVIEGIGIWWMP
jgi:stage II sporulation protein M